MQQRPTVYDLLQTRGVRQLTQVHVMSVDEAAACAEAGIDIVGTDIGPNLHAIAAAATGCFVQCGIPHGSISSPADAIRIAFDALDLGANAIYTSASIDVVRALAAEGVPVVGHIGLVPNRATWTNFRAIGKTLDEATQLHRELKELEDAGAFAVEIEVVPAHIATELTKRTTMLTMSMGSGSGCNTQYLFSDDILGENTGHVPRHAKVYRDFAAERRRLHAGLLAQLANGRRGERLPLLDEAAGKRPAPLERRVTALDTFEHTWERGEYWALVVLPPDRLPASSGETAVLRAAAGLERSKRLDEAATAYGTALQRWSGSFGALMGLGNVSYAKRDLNAAERAFRRAIAARPESPAPWNNLAYVLLGLNRKTEAVDAAREAVRLAGNNAAPYLETLEEISGKTG